jgi:hypothetical protein
MLTEEEKATNCATYEHIHAVHGLLVEVMLQLSNRILTHDKSKLLPPEVSTFVEFTSKLKGSTYGSPEYKQFLAEMKPALDHHYANNRHHPEHFTGGIDDMTLIDLIEMLVDWLAATRRHDDGDIYKPIKLNTERFNMSPQLVKILTNTVKDLEVA